MSLLACHTSDEVVVSLKTIRHMRLHKEGVRENDRVMVHPSNDEPWKALNSFDVDFASDARNVRIGLVTDDFSPFSKNVATYFCWSIFTMSYNLPPSLCMKYLRWSGKGLYVKGAKLR
jgi:hypothetical protein